MATDTKGLDQLKDAGSDALRALGSKLTSSVTERVGSLTDHLDSVAEGGPLKKAVAKGAEARPRVTRRSRAA